jgi:hypothetical protein
VFTRLTGRRQSSGLLFVHAVSSKTDEGMEALKLDIAEVLSHKWVPLENLTPSS